MLNKNNIVFLGDSFTWGEGLELYSEFPKWVNEREIDNNNWVILRDKQDEDSIKFRNEHRYPHLVASKLDCNYFVDTENGGTIARNMKVLKKILIDNLNVTDVVIQFSTYSRETLHMNFECSCDFCLDTHWAPILDNLNMFIIKKIDKNNGDNEIKRNEQKVFDYVSRKINNTDYTSTEFLNQVDDFVQTNFSRQLEFLCESYFKELKNSHNIRFHFIDSWCTTTSKILKKNDFIQPRLIPLIGKTDREYQTWYDWTQTFDTKLISEDFPKTGNGHPTLERHEYLGKSVYKHFASFFKLSYI